MLRNSSRVLGLCSRTAQLLGSQQQSVDQGVRPAVLQALVGAHQAQQSRSIGGDKIPEFWGRPSPYTEGTDFLGTPKDHLASLQKRPLSPDVIGLDGKSLHYKFPWAALSSITNRATGVALYVGTFAAAAIALRGDLPGTVNWLATSNVLLAFPLKFAVSYTIIYHYLGGIRHVIWDHAKYGNQADKNSLLELPNVELSSKGLFAASLALSLVVALM